MSGAAFRQFLEQVEAVREEAYREGYAAAIAVVRKFLEEGGGTPQPLLPHVTAASELNGSASLAAVAEITQGRPRGENRKLVLGALQSIAPRAAGPTMIIKIIQRDKGITVGYSSARHALNQLEEMGSIQEIGDTKMWRVIPNLETAEPSPEAPGDGST